MAGNIQEQDVAIPVNGEHLIGSIFFSELVAYKKTPWVIIVHGLKQHRKGKFVANYTEKFASANYHVLVYDSRGHGETAKQTGTNLFELMGNIYSDLDRVIDWVFETQGDRILDNKLVLFGRSLGGAMILTHGFKNPRAKILIALCIRHDYATLFSPKQHASMIKLMSPKYFLEKSPDNNKRILIAHCKDDLQIPYYPHLPAIQEQLGLNDENVITYETGGHSFKGNRENVFNAALKFLEENL